MTRATSFSAFLGRSLALLARDLPGLSRRLAAHLTGRHVRLQVDGDDVIVESDGADLSVNPYTPEAPPAVQLRTRAAAILGLIDGAWSLEEAVLADEIELFGGPADLAHFHEGLVLYLQAAVRCPALLPLHDEYRGGSQTSLRDGST